MSQLVLLSGKMGSGKTTLQKALCEDWYKRKKTGAVAANFADVLYEMHDAVLDVLHKYWPRRPIVKDGPLLQLIGTEWGRNTIDKDIWVKCLREKVGLMSRLVAPALVVVGDCRFENEFDAFPDALRVRLVCPAEIRKQRCTMWRENTQHPSEVGLDEYDSAKKFDLYLYTENTPIAGCVDLINAQLDKNVWKEKR